VVTKNTTAARSGRSAAVVGRKGGTGRYRRRRARARDVSSQSLELRD
jgi:hypothetical protein